MSADDQMDMSGLMDPSTEFGQMMKHAMGIKSAQMESDRKTFETWPQFRQNSLWLQNAAALALRELPPSERLAGVRELKEAGNAHFKAKAYAEAVEQYEAAVGSFVYAKQLDPDWRKKGIRDESIEWRDEAPAELRLGVFMSYR